MRTAFETAPFDADVRRNAGARQGSVLEQQFIQHLLLAVRPEIEALVKQMIANEGGQPLVVNYEEAGRMIGTTYEGIRNWCERAG